LRFVTDTFTGVRIGWPGLLWSLACRMRPTLPYIGLRGNARLTVLGMSDNQFYSGRTVQQDRVISTAQGQSDPPLCTTLHCTQVAHTPTQTLDTLPSDPRKIMHWASSGGLASAFEHLVNIGSHLHGRTE